MKPIPSLNLTDLLEGAASALLTEKRHDAESRIKQILIRQEKLAESIKAAENDLKKLNGKWDKSVAKINKLKAGDWSVLNEQDNEKDEQ